MNRFATRIASLLLIILLPLTVAAQDESKPAKIFTTEDVIGATVEAPWRDILRDKTADPTFQGNFKYTSADGTQVSIPITITLRGLTRRRICDFPPLRFDFDKEASKGTEFRGAGNLKLVTHCFRSERYAQYYVKEYLAYKMYNLVTEKSYRAQGLDLVYKDNTRSDKPVERFAFLIEDPDDVAKRNGLVKLSLPDTKPVRLDAMDTSRFMLFQLLIANLDWSALSGPGENKCCHNARLIGESPDATPLFVIPYDLDASGFVNTHYAAPPDNLRVRSVTDRLFRGFCDHNASLPAALEEYRALRSEFLGVIADEPRLDDRVRKYASRFIEEFYSDLETDKDVQKRLIGKCRG